MKTKLHLTDVRVHNDYNNGCKYYRLTYSTTEFNLSAGFNREFEIHGERFNFKSYIVEADEYRSELTYIGEVASIDDFKDIIEVDL